MRRYLRQETVGYLAGVLGVLAIALILAPFYPGVRVLTAANSLLMVVLFVALTWGMRPAFLASFLGALYLNYYYVPPLKQFDFHVDGAEDVIGLIAFMVTSIAVGQLSLRLRQRARENKDLYDQLRGAFDQTSHLEAVKRSEALKSALLDTVTHDLRTPLTSVKAAATAVISLRKNPEGRTAATEAAEDKLLGVVVQQADRLNRFIEGMIEMATIETGGTKKTPELTAVDEAVGEAVERAAPALQDHSVVVDCQDDFMAPVNAKAVTQVVFSLLENAGRYSAPGSTVRVAAQRCGEALQISVEDQGSGIPVAMRERIFEKFFRGERTGEPGDSHADGLGLGLSIARGIVEGQNGRIWVEERQDGNRGARLVFTLPLQPSLQEPWRTSDNPGSATLTELSK